jgi:thymidylate synthase (FAD)
MGKAFIIAETWIDFLALDEMLMHLGAGGWGTDSSNDAEILTEVAGRLCYKSFNTELNPNITRVREGNKQYLANVMKQKHGSIFEHATVTLALLDVSRVLTHELVRHRPGVGFSQESQRFVRLDTFDMYIPDLTDAFSELYDHLPERQMSKEDWVQNTQAKYIEALETVKGKATDELGDLIQGMGLDEAGVPFHVKKSITSALRRFIPSGVNTNIIITTNHRMWRHIIENRTAPGAEQEIVEVFGAVAEMFLVRYPNIYQDMIKYHVEGDRLPHYRFENQKI